jgi:hypothetical protein
VWGVTGFITDRRGLLGARLGRISG